MKHLLFALLIALTACQATPGTQNASHPFVGCWESEDGRAVEEWVQAPNGWLIGYAMNLNEAGETVFFEQMRIERDGEVEILFVTGGEDIRPIPFARAPTDNPNVYRFVNPEHDSPQVITYLPEPGVLNAQISAMDGSGAYDFPKRACD